MTAEDWKRRSVLKSWAISRTRRWKLQATNESVTQLHRKTTKEDERELADEELGRLLVTTNLAEGDRSGPVAVRLLDSTSGGGTLAGGLGGELLAGRLSSSRLAGGLLSLSSWSAGV